MANTNPSPKARFQRIGKAIETHRALIERDDLERGIDYALLEYQRMLANMDQSANSAAACHFRMLGALEFLTVFRNLGETAQLPTIVQTPSLNHKA